MQADAGQPPAADQRGDPVRALVGDGHRVPGHPPQRGGEDERPPLPAAVASSAVAGRSGVGAVTRSQKAVSCCTGVPPPARRRRPDSLPAAPVQDCVSSPCRPLSPTHLRQRRRRDRHDEKPHRQARTPDRRGAPILAAVTSGVPDLRQRLSAGQACAGVWSLLPGAVTGEVLARTGADHVVLGPAARRARRARPPGRHRRGGRGGLGSAGPHPQRPPRGRRPAARSRRPRRGGAQRRRCRPRARGGGGDPVRAGRAPVDRPAVRWRRPAPGDGDAGDRGGARGPRRRAGRRRARRDLRGPRRPRPRAGADVRGGPRRGCTR